MTELYALREKNVELVQENTKLLKKVRRLECMIGKIMNIVSDDASSDSESDGMLAIDDCAGSDTEEPPPVPSTPRLLQLHDGAVPTALALEGTTVPKPPALKDECAFGSAFGDHSASSVTMSLKKVADVIAGCNKSVLVICGAGISTASGIQDFRSPGGLYDTFDLHENDLPRPEALFELDVFKDKPEPFYQWASRNWPGSAQPSTTHYFLKLLYEKQKLLRCYSQNIDGLERAAGLGRRLVEAHGNFRSAHVVDTMKPVKPSTLKKALESNTWRKLREKHGGLVKPSIVFYGEKLPSSTRYFQHDIESAELLLVLGTSVRIGWVQDLIVQCQAQHKILINLEDVLNPWDCCTSDCKRDWSLWAKLSCDEACEELASHLGWSKELRGVDFR